MKDEAFSSSSFILHPSSFLRRAAIEATLKTVKGFGLTAAEEFHKKVMAELGQKVEKQ